MPALTRLVPVTLLVLVATAAAAAAQSAPPGDIVISEFRTRGPAGGNDEFIELRNRSSQPVDISGWRLQGCASGSGAASTRAAVGTEVRLAAGSVVPVRERRRGGLLRRGRA